jgi:hypothetical protein
MTDAIGIYFRDGNHFTFMGNSFEFSDASQKGIFADGVNAKKWVKIIGNSFNGNHKNSINFGSAGGGGLFDFVTIMGNSADSVQGSGSGFFVQSSGSILGMFPKGMGSIVRGS